MLRKRSFIYSVTDAVDGVMYSATLIRLESILSFPDFERERGWCIESITKSQMVE